MNDSWTFHDHRYNPAYRTGDMEYDIHLDDYFDRNHVQSILQEVLQDALDLMEGQEARAINSHDLLRYALYGREDEQIIGAFMAPATTVTVNRIMDYFEEKRSQYGAIAEEETFFLTRISFQYVLSPVLHSAPVSSDLPDERWYKSHATAVIRLRNHDHLCAARSLVILRERRRFARKEITRSKMRKLTRVESKNLYAAARRLSIDAGLATHEGVTVDDLQQFGDVMEALICVVSHIAPRVTHQTDWPSTVHEDADIPTYYLLQTPGHFEPITAMNLFQGSRKWCDTCLKGYANDNGHRCKKKCSCCFSRNCSSLALTYGNPKTHPINWQECTDCFRFFPKHHKAGEVSCFNKHIRNGACGRIWKCHRCDKNFQRSRVTPEQHRCSHRWCVSCKSYESVAHHRNGCFIKKTPLKTPSIKYVFSDIESVQETGVHEANLIISRDWDDTKTIHTNERDFVEWLLKHRQGHTFVFHNGGGYDLPLIYRYLCTHTKKSLSPIYNGTKLMYIQIGRGKKAIRFIDSLRWIGKPLSKFKATLGLSVEMEKGYFPHWFNTRANAEYRGPVPPCRFFKPERMTPQARKEFAKWYTQKLRATTRESTEFEGDWILKHELERYCDNDVAILREGCIKFRQMFLDLSDGECDPFTYITIAGTCHALYRAKFMPENSIAILPSFVSSELRRAMFGGRTNARRLFWQQSHPGEKAHYKDYTSLYPYVQWSKIFPHGHPRLIGDWNCTRGTETWRFYKRMKAKDQQAWQQPEMNVSKLPEYLRVGTLAIIQCDVQCPDDLYHPVLPARMPSGKLVFDLREKTQQWFASPELKRAIELGYRVTRIHKVAIWETVTTDLFREYVNTFLRIKQECSGWPDGCDTSLDRSAFVDAYNQYHNIQLRVDKICNNSGLREVAKLCLNSLWGKFGQRENMPRTELFHDASAYLKCVFNKKHTDVHIVPIHNPAGATVPGGLAGIYEVHYRMKEGLIRHSDKVNISLGVFTTSYARLHLHDALHTLGRQVLYHDTDSVIYTYDDTNANHVHLQEGRFLGQFTDELGRRHIVKFVSGGPKNYGYELNAPDRNGVVQHVTIKGFDMRAPEVRRNLSLKVMEEVVRARGVTSNGGVKRKITIRMPTIARDKKKKTVVNAVTQRSYQFVYDKGCVMDDYTVLPFGHRDIPRVRQQ